MNTYYYVFASEKIARIEAMIAQRKGTGFFNFQYHWKFIRQTSIPISNLSVNDYLIEYRIVLVLEANFSEEDAAIRLAAEQESEFYSALSDEILQYLQNFEPTAG